jgi:hypothetical protein
MTNVSIQRRIELLNLIGSKNSSKRNEERERVLKVAEALLSNPKLKEFYADSIVSTVDRVSVGFNSDFMEIMQIDQPAFETYPLNDWVKHIFLNNSTSEYWSFLVTKKAFAEIEESLDLISEKTLNF